jgi:peroxidase
VITVHQFRSRFVSHLNDQFSVFKGLPGYNSHRELCGLKRASDFDDLCETIPSVVSTKLKEFFKGREVKNNNELHRFVLQIVNRFKMLYESVDDIDLFIGGISERVAEGALVGPTFQCIIGQQFLRLKRGDRYFYDLGGQPGSFTKGNILLSLLSSHTFSSFH